MNVYKETESISTDDNPSQQHRLVTGMKSFNNMGGTLKITCMRSRQIAQSSSASSPASASGKRLASFLVAARYLASCLHHIGLCCESASARNMHQARGV